MERKGLIDPDYARILIAPRATIRKVVDRDPRDRVIALIMVSGFAGALAAAIEFQPPQALKIGAHLIPEISAAVMWKIRLGQVVTSPLIAVAFLYLDGALLRWSGRLLGGAAQAVEVRAALGWSSIPSAGIAVIFILLTLLHPAPAMPRDPRLAIATLEHEWPRFAIGAALGVYAFVVSIKCLAEVHRFSAWRGLGAWAVEKLLLAGAFFALAISVPLIAVFLFR